MDRIPNASEPCASSPATSTQLRMPTTTPSTFHPFIRLPSEIRRMIWAEFLDEQLGRIYVFRFRGRKDVGRGALLNQEGWDSITPSRPSRTLSAVCRDSREVVCEMFPDTVEFGYMDDDEWWRWWSDRDYVAKPAKGFIRYNGSRDMFMFDHIAVGIMHEIRPWLCGTENGDFKLPGLKNLGVCLSDFGDGGVLGMQATCPTPCNNLDCQPCIISRSFAQFFPDVTHLHIVDLSDNYSASRDGCFCNVKTAGRRYPLDVLGPQLHVWPRIKGPIKNRIYSSYHSVPTLHDWPQWFVIRDGGSDCKIAPSLYNNLSKIPWPISVPLRHHLGFNIQVRYVHALTVPITNNHLSHTPSSLLLGPEDPPRLRLIIPTDRNMATLPQD